MDILIILFLIYLSVLFIAWLYLCFSPEDGIVGSEKITKKLVADFFISYLIAAFLIPFYIILELFGKVKDI